MQIKKGVILSGLKEEMRPVLVFAENIWRKRGIVFDYDKKEYDLKKDGVTITSGLDGKHSVGSCHYYGYALDLRTRYFTKEQVKSIVRELKNILKNESEKYFVLDEKTHIHVQYSFYR